MERRFPNEYWNCVSYVNNERLCQSCSKPFLRIFKLLCNHLVCDPCRRKTPCPICVYDVSKVKPTRLLKKPSNELNKTGKKHSILSEIDQTRNRKSETKKEITEIFTKLDLELKNRNKGLLMEHNNIYYLQFKSLNDDEIFFKKARNTFILLNNLLRKRNQNPLTILKIRIKIIRTFYKLNDRPPSPREDGRINFNPSLFSLAKSNIKNLGFVFGDAVPEKTLVSGFGTEFVLVGMETYFTVTCFDYFKRQCLYGGEQIRATLIYPNNVIELEVKDLKAGLYKVIIKTDRNDPLPTLNITLKGFQIQRNLIISDFKFPPTFQFLSIQRKNIHRIISGTGQIPFSKKCWGLCCSNDGDIYVADKEYCCIFVFDHRFEFVGKFGIQGKGDGEFNKPTGICIDDSEILYVVDKDNHRVQLFTKDGRFIHKFGTRGSEAGKFEFPWSVATSPSYIGVSDSNNHRIQLFNKQCKFLVLYRMNYLVNPRGLYFVDDQTLLVSDFLNDDVYKFEIKKNNHKSSRCYSICESNFALLDLKIRAPICEQLLIKEPQGVFFYNDILFVAEAKYGNLHIFKKRYREEQTHNSKEGNCNKNNNHNHYQNIPQDALLYERINILNFNSRLLRELNLVGFNPCNIAMTPDGKLLVLHSKHENLRNISEMLGSYLVCLDLSVGRLMTWKKNNH